LESLTHGSGADRIHAENVSNRNILPSASEHAVAEAIRVRRRQKQATARLDQPAQTLETANGSEKCSNTESMISAPNGARGP